MKKYVAIYTEKKGGLLNNMVDTYKSKEKFREDIIANGLHCVAILTQEQLEEIKNNRFGLTGYVGLSLRTIEYIQQCM